MLTESKSIPRTTELLKEIGAATGNCIAVAGITGYLAMSSVSPALDPRTKLEQISRHFSSTPWHAQGLNTTGLLLAGPDVSVCSVQLEQDCRSEAEIERALRRMRRGADWNEDNSNSIALMFACCTRGSGFHRGRRNFESAIFARVFPRTPLGRTEGRTV